MINSRVIIALVTFCFLILMGCKPAKQHENLFAEDRYIGHLQLDSSVLIMTEVAGDLEVPWEVTYGSDDRLWFTEQKGTVTRLNPETGEQKVLLQLPDVHYKKSRGLLGMALHPDLSREPYVYLHYNFAFETENKIEEIRSRLVRYTYQGDTLTDPEILLDSIPGKSYHNGSRIIITPDQKLFISIGDVGATELAQDLDHITGKILRMNLDGSVPEDNPFPNSLIWTWGHRNPQGLVYAPNGNIYSSGHGPNNDDEVNLIRKGSNYGWPYVEGYCDVENEKQFCKDSSVVEPLIAWTPTIAVAGLDYYAHETIPEWQNSLLLVNLKGRALRALDLNEAGDAVSQEHIFFQKHFGRMRDLAVAPNGDVYLATSNQDWHPRLQPFMYDSLPEGGDRIIRLQKADQSMLAQLENIAQPVALTEEVEAVEMLSETWDFEPTDNKLATGQALYMQHCASCHRPDGQGVEEMIPPLAQTKWVTGDKGRLIQVLLTGLSEPIEVEGITYEQEMPSYANLSDEELASILTYIRQSFGNEAGSVIAGEVYEERKGL